MTATDRQYVDGPRPAVVSAPAKLTATLAVTGVRDDGYHLLESEMLTLDLCDTLEIATCAPGERSTLEVAAAWPGLDDGAAWRTLSVGPPEDNLVTRALRAVDRAAHVRLVKRIPPGAGLGGGSADAAAVLRWAGCADRGIAARLGADVPFCVSGGRALVTGIGDSVEQVPFEERTFVLLLPPFGVDTTAVYRRWDEMHATGALPAPGTVTNDLEAPAVSVEPRLSGWKAVLEEWTGRPAVMAGSGSTWFVELDARTKAEAALLPRAGVLEHDGTTALVVVASALPAQE
jgi:4-diphosphocytidyl-2-C-methyl-D-erythritol kinase